MIRLSAPNLGDKECKAVERILRSGQLVHGEECELFEKELSEYLGVTDVIAVSSGTAALHLSLIALGVGHGDAVLVPDFTFPATVNVVELVGARPVFVDVDICTYNVTCESLEEAVESWKGPERLKAIIPVHEFGCPADMIGIMALAKEHSLLVIEDAACALGATHNRFKVGNFGVTGCFSFHPRKSLTTGEGGAIATNNIALAVKLRQWRSHGMQSSPHGMQFMVPGFNYRMTNFQAALGRVQLPRLDGWLKERRQLQQIYHQELQHTTLSLPNIIEGHTWQTYMVILPKSMNQADTILKFKKAGIEANLGAQAIHCQVYYQKKYPKDAAQLTGNNAECLFKQGLALPLHQGLAASDISLTTQTLKNHIS